MDLVTLILACSLYTNNSTVNAMVKLGSNNNALTIAIPDENGQMIKRTYKTPEQAALAAAECIKQGDAIEIGLMQIPSLWLEKFPNNLRELFLPCRNMVVATNILNQATHDDCTGSQVGDTKTCALSVYKTGNAVDGVDYASEVLDYASKHPFRKSQNSGKSSTSKKAKSSSSDISQTTDTTDAPIVDNPTSEIVN